MKSIIKEITTFIKEQNFNIYGVSEICDGKLYSEQIVPAPYCSDLYSVSKFISGAAVGLAYDRGLLDINKPICELIVNCPEPKEAKWKEVTLHDCLRHKTGLINGNLDIDNEKYAGITDWLDYIFALPIEGERDVDYHYTDAAFYLACRAVETAVKENVYSFLQRELLSKLNFRESAWSVCPKGYVTGGSGFFGNDSDIARLGFLWANEGKFDGEQLISKEYVDLSLKNGYGIAKRNEFPDCYYKTGANGQIILMLPKEHYALMIRGFYSSDGRTDIIDKFFTK